MKTIADRLIHARRLAGYEKASEAITAFGFSEYTYYQHENGTREPGKPSMERYAKAFKVSADWLWRGLGDMKGASSGDPDTAEVVSIMSKLDERRRREIAEFARFKAATPEKLDKK